MDSTPFTEQPEWKSYNFRVSKVKDYVAVHALSGTFTERHINCSSLDIHPSNHMHIPFLQSLI